MVDTDLLPFDMTDFVGHNRSLANQGCIKSESTSEKRLGKRKSTLSCHLTEAEANTDNKCSMNSSAKVS